MKILLTIICLVLMSSYSYSEELPSDGPYETFYENGQLQSKGNYKDGNEHGLREVFYENGKLKFKINYKNGEYNGLYERYHENGQVGMRVNYKEGKRHGWERTYKRNGEERLPLGIDGQGFPMCWYEGQRVMRRTNPYWCEN